MNFASGMAIVASHLHDIACTNFSSIRPFIPKCDRKGWKPEQEHHTQRSLVSSRYHFHEPSIARNKEYPFRRHQEYRDS